MSEKLKVGIIGCGTIGSTHADSYAKVDTVEVVALCDILPDRLAEKSKRHGIAKTYENYHDLLADPEIEAVSVCTPNDMHAPIAIDALKAGKHVMLEKPMTLNADLARQIVAARDASGKTLQLGMVWRQHSDAKAIKEVIDSGRLGEIYQVRIKLIRRRGIPGLGGWFTTKERSGGGGLIDIAVHFLDLAMYLTSYWEPTRVSAKTYTKFGTPMEDYHYINMWAGPPDYNGVFNVDDYAAGFVRFGKKATMSFEVAWACNAEDDVSVEFLGDKGGIKFCPGKPAVIRTEMDGKLADITLNYAKDDEQFPRQLAMFADAVRGKGTVPATGEQGIMMMRLLDAIYKSSELDQEVEV